MAGKKQIEVNWLRCWESPGEVQVRSGACAGSLPEDRSHTHRLPGYDSGTRGSELAAFSSIGLVAVSLIGFAVFESMRFARDRDCIVATFSGGAPEGLAAAACTNTAKAVTNLAAVRARGQCGQSVVMPASLSLPCSW